MGRACRRRTSSITCNVTASAEGVVTTASDMQATLSGALIMRVRMLEQLQDAPDGNHGPGGAVFQFVAEFAEGAFEQVVREEDLEFLGRLRQEVGPGGVLLIGADEGRRNPDVPEVNPRQQARDIFGTNHAGGSAAVTARAEQGTESRVVEGAEHGGYVADWRALDAPFAQG